MVSGGLQTLVLPCWIASAVAAWMMCGLLAARGAGFVWRRLWSPPRRDSRAGDSISAGDWSDADALPSPDPDDDAPPPGRRALRPELLLAAMIAIPLGVGCAIRSDGAFVRRSAERSSAATTEACREGRFDDAEAGVRRTFALARRSSGWEPGREDAFLHEIVDATAEFLETAPPLSGERGHPREQALLRPVACAVHLASDSGKDPTSDEEISALIYRFERMAARYEEEGELLHAEIVTRAELFLVDDPRTEESTSVSRLLDRLGRILAKTRPNDALAVLVRHLDVLERRHGESDPALLPLLDRFGAVLKSLNRPAEAETHLRRALAIRESNPDTAPVEFAFALDALANVVADQGRLEEAAELLRRALDRQIEASGSDCGWSAMRRVYLAAVLARTGDAGREESVAQYRAAYETRPRLQPEERAWLSSVDLRLAEALEAAGRPEEAERVLRESLGDAVANPSPSEPDRALERLRVLGETLERREDSGDPLGARRETLRLAEELVGAESRETASRLNGLAAALAEHAEKIEDPESEKRKEIADEAIRLARRAREILRKLDSPDPGLATEIAATLARALALAGASDEAERELRDSVAEVAGLSGPEAWKTEIVRTAALRDFLLAAGRKGDADLEMAAVLAKHVEGLKKERPEPETELAVADQVAEAFDAQDRPDPGAEHFFRRAVELREKRPESFDLGHALVRHGTFLVKTGRPDEAAERYERAHGLFERVKADDEWLEWVETALFHLRMDSGRWEDAEKWAARRLARLKARGETEGAACAAATIELAYARSRISPSDPKHEEAIRRGIALIERASAKDPDEPTIVHAWLVLAGYLTLHERFEETLEAFDRALAGAEDSPSEEVRIEGYRANALVRLGRLEEADVLYRSVIESMERSAGLADREVVQYRMRHADCLRDLDRLEEAETLHRRSLDALEKELGVADAKTLAARARLADLLVVAKRFDEAEALLRASLEAVRADAKPDSFDVRYEVMALANLLASQGRHDESDALIAPHLAEIDAATTPEAESELLGTMVRIGRHLRKSDRPDRAEPLLRRALAIRERAGPDHREVASSLYELAGLLGYTSRADEALPIYRRALEIQESGDGPDDGMTLTIRADLGSLLLTEGRLEEAERVLRAGISRPTPEGTPPPGWTERTRLPGAIHAQADLAIALLRTGRREEGEREAERALELIRERDPKERSAALQTRRGRLLRETGRADEAVTALRRALELDEESFLEGHSGRLRSATELALALREAGLDDEAERLESENREIQRRFRERTGFQHRLSDGP